MRVHELVPGMKFELKGFTPIVSGTVICTAPHPVYEGFTLVVWKLSDGTMSFDALSPMQELYMSEWIGQTPIQMQEAWKKAIGLKHG
jgi:hypothetical protein